MSRPGDREGERAFAKAEVVSITVTGKAGASTDPKGNEVVLAKGVENATLNAGNAAVSGGKVTFEASITGPEWSKNLVATDIEFKYQVESNGVVVVPEITTAINPTKAGGNLYTFTESNISHSTPAGAGISAALPVKVTITEITYKAADIKYVDDDMNDITADVLKAAGTTLDNTSSSESKLSTSTTGTSFGVGYTSADKTTTKLTAKIISGSGTGVTGEALSAALSTATASGLSTAATALKANAKGDGFVVVQISGIKDLKPLFTLTADTANLTNGTGVAISGFGPGSGAELLKLAIGPAEAGTGIESTKPVTVDAAISAATTFYAYKVKIVGLGETGWLNTTDGLTGRIFSGTISGNRVIKDSDITIEVVEKFAATKAEQTGDKLTVTFNRPVDAGAVKPSDLVINPGTFTIGSIAQAGERAIELTLSGTIASNNVITIGTGVVDKENTANAASGTQTLTATVSGSTTTWAVS